MMRTLSSGVMLYIVGQNIVTNFEQAFVTKRPIVSNDNSKVEVIKSDNDKQSGTKKKKDEEKSCTRSGSLNSLIKSSQQFPFNVLNIKEEIMNRIITAKSIDEAKQALLDNLNLDKFEFYDFEVIQEPTKGFLGIGSKDAEVNSNQNG